MKISLDIKNISKIQRPSTNDVIVYDGQSYYVTTKQDLLKEAYDLVNQAKKELAAIKADNQKFKVETSSTIVELTNTVKALLNLKKGE